MRGRAKGRGAPWRKAIRREDIGGLNVEWGLLGIWTVMELRRLKPKV